MNHGGFMTEVTLQFDKQAKQNIVKLMQHYEVDSYAAIIKKALVLLKEVSEAEDNKSDLVIRSDAGKKLYIQRHR
jgi:hypothetical protein